jgi:hypothetical protein
MEPSEPFTIDDAQDVDGRMLRDFLAHPAYVTFYQPFIVGCILRLTRDLKDPSRERAWKRPDNYLRGGIKVLEELLALPEAILNARALQAQQSDETGGVETYDQHVARVARERHEQSGEAEGLSPTDPV